MRSGAPAGHVGFFHEGVIFDSDDELVEIVVPYLRGAVAAGEPVLASLQDDQALTVRSALNGEASAISFLDPLTSRMQPVTAFETIRSKLDEIGDGPAQICIVTTVPHPGMGAPWDAWCRYEAASNDIFADLSIWGMCLYDRRITPDNVVADVEQTHPRMTQNGRRHLPNSSYREPRDFVQSMSPPPPDPLERRPPDIELNDPQPAQGRRAVQELARRSGLPADETERLVAATSEAVTNGMQHGQPPVAVKLWAGTGRIVLTVSDRGPGPDDLYPGLAPRPRLGTDIGGFGLWLMNQLATVTYGRTTDGFTVRLAAGDAHPLRRAAGAGAGRAGAGSA